MPSMTFYYSSGLGSSSRQRQWLLAAQDDHGACNCFVEYAYKYNHHLVKVLEFAMPRSRCYVYLDLKKEQCANLFLGARLNSETFHLGGTGFSCQLIALWTTKSAIPLLRPFPSNARQGIYACLIPS